MSESFDLSSVRSQLAKLQLGQITPEFFEELYGENSHNLLQVFYPAVEMLIKELLSEVGNIEDEDSSERAAQLMLRELAATSFVAGLAVGGVISPYSGFTVDISPDAATELVRSLLSGQGFNFSFEVKE